MAPRKKARLSTATSPEPSNPKTPTPSPQSAAKDNDEALLSDPWTDEEDIGLFKGLMRWKPTGIHKHFRLMQLHAWLLENRYIHPSNEHTRPQGIWRKLETLYDLPALDAREDARQLPKLESPLLEDVTMKDEERERALDDADVYSEADNRIEEDDFALPPDAEDEEGFGFEEAMWRRRLPSKPEEADEDGESEAEMPELNLAEEPPVRFVPSFSIEPSEAATPGSRRGRSAKRGSASEAKPGAAKTGTRRSARQAESVADEDEEAEQEENVEGDGDEEDEGEGEESEEASQASTPAPRSTRATKGGKGKPAAKSKGRTRKR